MFMRQLTVLILGILFSSSALFSQRTPTAATDPALDKIARESTVKLTEKYGLDADQAKQTYRVQLRKQRNLASIEQYKTTNPAQYKSKLEGVQQGTLRSIRKVLHSKEQVAKFDATKQTLRNKRSELRKTMMQNKATAEEIDLALLSIFEE
jgi:hypothetical protein